MSAYDVVIGLEIHCQLKTKTKLFSSDPYLYGDSANSQAGPVTLALPGTLPVLNQEARRMAVMAALALHCKIAEFSKFDRKHYFYPDLPKGYQISQYDQPYALGGRMTFRRKDLSLGKVRIHRIHIEEDAGKLIHVAQNSQNRESSSYVDLNRAGVPLLEIVTEPDLSSPQDASDFLQGLRSLLRSLEITDGNMEEGSLRCDANVSVRKGPDAPLGTRVEIKNLNSFKAARTAISYEIERQTELIESGGSVVQSTVLWDADQRKTLLMRTKEDAEDYRYFPEPDLLALHIPESFVKKIRSSFPELPEERRERYVKELEIPEKDADVLIREKEVAEYFEKVYAVSKDAKKSANWVKDEVLGILNKKKISIGEFPCTAKRLGRMLQLLNESKITGPIAKQVFERIYTEDLDPDTIIEKYNYKPVNFGDLETLIEKVFRENKESVEKILKGNVRVQGYLVGQVMKETRGQAPPQELNRLIEKKLENLKKPAASS